MTPCGGGDEGPRRGPWLPLLYQERSRGPNSPTAQTSPAPLPDLNVQQITGSPVGSCYAVLTALFTASLLP